MPSMGSRIQTTPLVPRGRRPPRPAARRRAGRRGDGPGQPLGGGVGAVTMSMALDLVPATSTPSRRSRTIEPPASRAVTQGQVAQRRPGRAAGRGRQRSLPITERGPRRPQRWGSSPPRRCPSRPARRRRRRGRPLAALDGGPLDQQVRTIATNRGSVPEVRHAARLEPEPLGGRHAPRCRGRRRPPCGRRRTRSARAPPADPLAGELLQVVVDVGLEPRHLRRPGPGAEDEVVLVHPAGDLGDPVDDVRRGGAVLGEVGAALRPAAVVHGVGDRVGHEQEMRVAARSRTASTTASTTGSRKPGWFQ